MPLNKLDNFIKNTEGRILYVSPADLDSTDSIDNTGNSLARPFKTIQRALIEAARFSYVGGTNNDEIEKTTILLMPGEHVVDNRPGFKIKNVSDQAKVVSPSGTETFATTTLDLNLTTNFNLTAEDNILYKFNSVNGGVIVPRGTSIVGLDLRKTKVRPLYVPNPTDSAVDPSAIFRITGTCYFWQFSLFDGNDAGKVYTDPVDFSTNNKSRPIFSHHKLTCFEYADGVNNVSGYDLTDLDMYYAKLSNAYGPGSGSPSRFIDKKYPLNEDDFAKQRPEWEIVGAFATDPIEISSIESGSGGTPSNTVTVTTATDHELSVGTPIKISGVTPEDYNITAKVQSVSSPRVFTYLLPTFRIGLTTPGNASGATVKIETDTVTGASPYIFNISMRSVYGMNGMHADGSKASGFRSMVVAQFTGVSLQKDDRAFVKYNKSNRTYSGISISKVTGSDLSGGSSATNPAEIYHSDSEAIYRNGWEQSHIKMSNDAIVQIVSVFAIGYNKHFVCESGGDASVTNSNSNFGQLSLVSDGFKKEAFDKDNKAFITNVIPPRAIVSSEENIDWLSIDVGVTTAVGNSSRLYLRGFDSEDSIPPTLTQGYRVGAKVADKLFVNIDGTDYSANILMENGTDNSFREFNVSSVSSSELTVTSHGLSTGEKVILISDDGNYPENIAPHIVYYVISVNSNTIKLASTKTDAENRVAITLYHSGSNLRLFSRVSDKIAGDAGHPVQFDSSNPGGWYINVSSGNDIYTQLDSLGVDGVGDDETEATFIKRKQDSRSLDEKIYKFRVVVPKELANAKTPESGFIIQESSTTDARGASDFTDITITVDDYAFKRNQRFIATCSHTSSTSTVRVESPHNLDVGDQIIIRNVKDTANTSGVGNSGYNGTFTVASTPNNLEFTYTNTQSPGSFTNNTSVRDENLPRYERNDLQSNLYIYRNEIISDYIDGQQDGIYHLYVLKADATIGDEFTDLKYGQNVTDLYPQLDRDNLNDSPASTKTYAANFPIGEVYTSDLKNSVTREAADSLFTKLNKNLTVSGVSALSSGTQTITFTRDHGFGGLVQGTISDSGTGYNSGGSGTFYNVKILTGGEGGSWEGATAKVVVTGGGITSLDIMSPGSDYSAGTYYIDASTLGSGGGSGARIAVLSTEIVSPVGDVVQITGISTISDAYYRIDSVPDTNKISIAKTAGDPIVALNHVAIHVGPSVTVSSTSFNTDTTTFNCSGPHGLSKGNRFRVIDTSNNNLGDYIVSTVTDYNTFKAVTTSALTSPQYILNHYFSANDGSSDRSDENLATRGRSFYDKDSLNIDTGGSSVGITTTLIPVSHPSSGIGIEKRFPLGSYIQVDNEIMRVASSTLVGLNKLSVIRGALATKVETHANQSLIKKINPISIEFRRPSIIRASGHTFEYLGYGPGNYSTGLPQVQTRTLTEKEEFLSQAQERSSGIVVYTGMNNRGDFYIGNTKKSSATGEETSFDTPIPTITGEDPARLSSIFDEVTIKERIVVEGGDSNEILSQFDGPVTFNGKVNFNNDIRIKNVKSNDVNTSIITASDINAGRITVDNIVRIDDRQITSLSGNLEINADAASVVAIQTNTTLSGSLNITGSTTISDLLETDTLTVTSSANIGTLDITNMSISGILTTNQIQTSSGNLTITPAAGSSVAIQTNTTVSGTLTADYVDAANVVPIGTIQMWGGRESGIPQYLTHWLECAGQELAIADYPTLYNHLTYGPGGPNTEFPHGANTNGEGDPGSTHFRLPDLRGRFVAGAGTNAEFTETSTPIASGSTGGSTNAVVVSHTHDLDSSGNLTLTDPGHDHGYDRPSGSGDNASGADEEGIISASDTDTATTGISISGSTETEGVSGTNANLPPYYGLVFMIKVS